MFSTELTFTLDAAFKEAVNREHAYFCVEHVLFALLHDDEMVSVVRGAGADPDLILSDLESFFADHIEKGDSAAVPEQVPAVERVLKRAILQSHSAGKKSVTLQDVIVAILDENESHASFFITKQGVRKLDFLNFISHGVSALPDNHEYAEGDEEGEGRTPGNRRSALERLTDDLTEAATQGELDPVIGRDDELHRALKVLCRRQKNNPIFVGEPGVGKTAMGNAIAQAIAGGKVPQQLIEARVFSLDMGSLIAGTKFRGEFEERIKAVLNELKRIEKPILYIDEIHTLVGAGATGNGSLDAANLLKPALVSGKIRCIGSTTHEDFKKSFEKDRALSRRFSAIQLEEPSVEQTVAILEGLKGKFEEHHGVKYPKKVLTAAASLAAKHITERFLPDKAIDVLDEAGAANSMLTPSKRKKTLSVVDIEKVVSAIARVPVSSVESKEADELRFLERNLKAIVFGQDEAVSAVAQSIKRSRVGLQGDQKTIGAFLFAGPTGVGKTELAKALASVLGIEFHRFDMSEYMEKHAVARLIGAPPGYIGYDEGGQLTDTVRKHPHSVILLDEIEKAHEDIYNILLQVFDDASLTDSQGRKTDFRNTVIILTTNAGSESHSAIGFGSTRKHDRREEAIKKQFRPEFRNRLDEVVYFHSLPLEIMEQVVDKFIGQLEMQLAEKGVVVELTSQARKWLAENGFDDRLGARPMSRLIQREIKDKLTDEILFGSLQKGGKVKILVGESELKLEYEKRAPENVKA